MQQRTGAGGLERSQALRAHRRDCAGQQVTHSAGGHARAAGGDHAWDALRCGDQGAAQAPEEGFDLSTVPYAAILRMAMPHRNVECDADKGYVVPYNNIGYSQHAVYMKLGASQWLTKATVDGKYYSAILYMAQPSGQRLILSSGSV